MKVSARAAALSDTAVLELAKRIERKRIALADNKLLAQITPADSNKGLLRRFGLGKIDIIASPEMTLAKMLKEWRALDAHYAAHEANPSSKQTTAEMIRAHIEEVSNRICLIEYRVFGNNMGNSYPEFGGAAVWLAWRLAIAHPEHRCDDGSIGWKPELFRWAFEESKLAF